MARPKSRYPKELRKKKTKLGTRLKTPFQSMSNCDIVWYFLRNSSFIKTYMNYTKQDYVSAQQSIREGLEYVNKEEFAEFVKICQRSFKAKDQDGRGFDYYIVAFLQDLKYEYKLQAKGEILPEPLQEQWFFPSLQINKGDTFLYDIAYDFFIENFSLKDIQIKYELSSEEVIQALKEIRRQEITPLPL